MAHIYTLTESLLKINVSSCLVLADEGLYPEKGDPGISNSKDTHVVHIGIGHYNTISSIIFLFKVGLYKLLWASLT